MEAVFLLLEIFSVVTVHNHELNIALTKQGLMEIVIGKFGLSDDKIKTCEAMLNHAYRSEVAAKAEKGEPEQKPYGVHKEEAPTISFGFKKSLVKIIGNLSYQNPTAQEQVCQL